MAFGGDVLSRAPQHEAPRRPTCAASWQREGPTLVSYRCAITSTQGERECGCECGCGCGLEICAARSRVALTQRGAARGEDDRKRGARGRKRRAAATPETIAAHADPIPKARKANGESARPRRHARARARTSEEEQRRGAEQRALFFF